MSTVEVLIAASYGYATSPTGVRPPLATGLFEAFLQLDISGDLGTKALWVIDYVKDKYGIPNKQFVVPHGRRRIGDGAGRRRRAACAAPS